MPVITNAYITSIWTYDEHGPYYNHYMQCEINGRLHNKQTDTSTDRTEQEKHTMLVQWVVSLIIAE